MRLSLSPGGLALLFFSSSVLAFPSYAIKEMANKEPKLILRAPQQNSGGTTPNSFDATSQYVDTTGEHAFVPPNLSGGDQRGPCPGLNALANHGYLPHNGVASIPQLISATEQVYGMSFDLGNFLAIYGTIFDGNVLSLNPGYSIGGPTPASQNILGNVGGLIGMPQGLSGSHNKYETDSSPTRGDLYVEGNSYKLVLSRFENYYNALLEDTPADQQYQGLLNFRIHSFQDSIQNNPYFFYAPFAGILVSPAGFAFPKAMMSNHSAEYSAGYLSRENLMSFFAVTGEPGSFQYTEGAERIPDNWYRRPLTNEYGINSYVADVLDFGVQYPPFLSTGGNTGTPNSFTGVDIGDLTGGVFNAATLTEGNNLECFVFQAMLAEAPDVLESQYSNVLSAFLPLSATIASQLATLGCPQLTKLNTAMFEAYPGYMKLGEGI